MNLSDISLNIYSFGYSAGFINDPARRREPLGLEELVRCAKEYRLGGVEFPFDRYFDVEHIDHGVQVAKDIQDQGLRVFLDIESMDVAYIKALLPCIRSMDMDVIRVKMNQIGRTIYGGNRYASPTFLDAIAEFEQQLCALRPLLEDAGVVLAVENHQDLHSSELATICMDDCNCLGVTWDVGNSVSVVDTPESFYRATSSFVRNVHLKDYRIVRSEKGIRLTRCAIGEGYVDFREVFKGLLRNRALVSNMSIELGAQMSRHCDIGVPEYWAPYSGMEISRSDFIRYIDSQLSDAEAPVSAYELGLDEDQVIRDEFAEIEASVAHIESIMAEQSND